MGTSNKPAYEKPVINTIEVAQAYNDFCQAHQEYSQDQRIFHEWFKSRVKSDRAGVRALAMMLNLQNASRRLTNLLIALECEDGRG